MKTIRMDLRELESESFQEAERHATDTQNAMQD